MYREIHFKLHILENTKRSQNLFDSGWKIIIGIINMFFHYDDDYYVHVRIFYGYLTEDVGKL